MSRFFDQTKHPIIKKNIDRNAAKQVGLPRRRPNLNYPQDLKSYLQSEENYHIETRKYWYPTADESKATDVALKERNYMSYNYAYSHKMSHICFKLDDTRFEAENLGGPTNLLRTKYTLKMKEEWPMPSNRGSISEAGFTKQTFPPDTIIDNVKVKFNMQFKVKWRASNAKPYLCRMFIFERFKPDEINSDIWDIMRDKGSNLWLFYMLSKLLKYDRVESGYAKDWRENLFKYGAKLLTDKMWSIHPKRNIQDNTVQHGSSTFNWYSKGRGTEVVNKEFEITLPWRRRHYGWRGSFGRFMDQPNNDVYVVFIHDFKHDADRDFDTMATPCTFKIQADDKKTFAARFPEVQPLWETGGRVQQSLDWFYFDKEVPRYDSKTYNSVWNTDLSSSWIDPAAAVYLAYGSSSAKWKKWLDFNGEEPDKTTWWESFKDWFKGLFSRWTGGAASTNDEDEIVPYNTNYDEQNDTWIDEQQVEYRDTGVRVNGGTVESNAVSAGAVALSLYIIWAAAAGAEYLIKHNQEIQGTFEEGKLRLETHPNEFTVRQWLDDNEMKYSIDPILVWDEASLDLHTEVYLKPKYHYPPKFSTPIHMSRYFNLVREQYGKTAAARLGMRNRLSKAYDTIEMPNGYEGASTWKVINKKFVTQQPGYETFAWGNILNRPSRINGPESKDQEEDTEITPMDPISYERTYRPEDELELHPQRPDRYKNTGTDEMSEYSDEQEEDGGIGPREIVLHDDNYMLRVKLMKYQDATTQNDFLEVTIHPIVYVEDPGMYIRYNEDNFGVLTLTIAQMVLTSSPNGINFRFRPEINQVTIFRIPRSQLVEHDLNLQDDSVYWVRISGLDNVTAVDWTNVTQTTDTDYYQDTNTYDAASGTFRVPLNNGTWENMIRIKAVESAVSVYPDDEEWIDNPQDSED